MIRNKRRESYSPYRNRRDGGRTSGNIVGVAMYLAGVYFGPWSMLVTGVVLLLCIVVGTRWSVNYLNDEISYKQALVAGVVIAISTGAVYAVCNLVSINFFYSNFLDELVRLQMAQRQSAKSFDSLRAGVSASEIAVANLIRLSVMVPKLPFGGFAKHESRCVF